MIRYRCGMCGNRLESPVSMTGQTEICPECGTAVRVPRGEAGDEGKRPIHRAKLAGLFVFTYVFAVLLVGLPFSGDAQAFIAIVGFFPLGLFFLLGCFGHEGWSLGAATAAGWCLYLGLAIVGVSLRSVKVFLIFLLMLLLNVVGCYSVILRMG